MNIYRCTSGSTQQIVRADSTSEAMDKFTTATGSSARETRVAML